MLLILSGPSTVGKSYSISQFTELYAFETILPFTTRDPRDMEYEGVHYHFVSKAELKKISYNFTKGYWAQPFGDHYYGYPEIIASLPEESKNWIIHAETGLALDIKKRHPDGTYLVFIDYKDDKKHEERLQQRFANLKDIDSRLRHDKAERDNKQYFDNVIISDDIDEIARDLYRYVSTIVVQPIRSYGLYPGTLSDIDIINSIKDPNGIKVEGLAEHELDRRVQGWTLDLTLGTRYFRVKKRLFKFEIFDLAYSNENDMIKRFPDQAADAKNLYGIVLKQGEFILGTTAEKITLPKNIVGLVSGRSSYARAGIAIEFSQNVLQSGHNDTVPLQIKNNLPYPVRIYPGTGIAQVVFFKTSNQTDKMYSRQFNPKYIGRNNDFRSRIYDVCIPVQFRHPFRRNSGTCSD